MEGIQLSSTQRADSSLLYNYKTPVSAGKASSLVTHQKEKLLRVASYCRVSTEEELQLNSLENQIMHYTNYIRANPEWQFAGIYSDRGKSGTKAASRDGFQKLLRDAIEGRIDLILCKSISRFARNVVDALNTVRLLKEYGVRVRFEKESIDTGSMQSEFIMVLLSAISQEESRNISENVKWAYSKRFERGEPIFTRMLGYTKDKENKWIIIEEEARIVREAFEQCLKGMRSSEIARLFIQKGYKKANGRIDWTSLAIRDILRNERYVGDAFCQKTYTKDHLSHKIMINNGERPKYLIKDHHEAIVDRSTYDLAQGTISKRTKKGERGQRKTYPLSGRLICGECGGNLQRYICRGVVTWRCGNHIKSNQFCSITGILEEDIYKALLKAFNKRYNFRGNKIEKDSMARMIKEIKGAVLAREVEQNQLRLELEKALLEENKAFINSSEVSYFTEKRVVIEGRIAERESLWKQFDEDDEYRKAALVLLESIKFMEWKIKDIREGISDISFLRAWVVRIKILSPILISITWLTGEETKVEIKKGVESRRHE